MAVGFQRKTFGIRTFEQGKLASVLLLLFHNSNFHVSLAVSISVFFYRHSRSSSSHDGTLRECSLPRERAKVGRAVFSHDS